jgi:hypothetical protein
MGLDMYLSAKRYLSDYNEEEKSVKTEVDKIPISGKGFMQVKEITCEAMYWRKSNAIHKWFVDNCQDGIDECQESYVSIEDLKNLRNICSEVLADVSKANELLPPQSGFFFGGTDIDEYYIADLRETVEVFDKILQTPDVDRWSFTYQSSW